MTATIDRPEAPSPAPDAPKRSHSPFLKVMVALLAVVALGLGAVVVYDLASGESGDGSAVPSDVQQVLDDYLDAWDATDADALRALVTDDFVLNEHVYYADGDDQLFSRDADNLGLNIEATDYTIENFGTPVTSGDGPWFVSVGENWTSEFARWDGIASYVIVDEDGTLRIARHNWAGNRSVSDPPWAE